MKCEVCQKDTDGRSTCSNACRTKLSRMKKKGTTPAIESVVVEKKGLTDVDALFEFARPGYYKYDNDTYARYCLQCKKDFSTRTRYRRVCSPTCESKLLTRLTGMDKDA